MIILRDDPGYHFHVSDRLYLEIPVVYGYHASIMNLRIETDRLLLRPLELSDAERMFILDSDPVVCQYLGTQPVESNEVSKKIIQGIIQQYEDTGVGRLAVILKDEDKMIGWCGLKWHKEEVNGVKEFYDLGFRFIPQYWGKGIATEASRAVVNEAFLTLPIDKIYAYADTRNKASIRVLEKIGFQYIKLFYDRDELCSWYELSRQSYSDHR